jgi:hypothetical protein
MRRIVRETFLGLLVIFFLCVFYFLYRIAFEYRVDTKDHAYAFLSGGYILAICYSLFALPIIFSVDHYLYDLIPLKPSFAFRRAVSREKWHLIAYGFFLPAIFGILFQKAGSPSVWYSINLVLMGWLCVTIPIYEKMAGISWTIVFFFPRILGFGIVEILYRWIRNYSWFRESRFQAFRYALAILVSGMMITFWIDNPSFNVFFHRTLNDSTMGWVLYFLFPSISFLCATGVNDTLQFPGIIALVQALMLIGVLVGIWIAWRRLDAKIIAAQGAKFERALSEERRVLAKAQKRSKKAKSDDWNGAELPYIEGATPEEQLVRADWHWARQIGTNSVVKDPRYFIKIWLLGLLMIAAMILNARGMIIYGRERSIWSQVIRYDFLVLFLFWGLDIFGTVVLPKTWLYCPLPVRPAKAVVSWWRREWLKVVALDLAVIALFLLIPNHPKGNALLFIFCIALASRLSRQLWESLLGVGALKSVEMIFAFLCSIAIMISIIVCGVWISRLFIQNPPDSVLIVILLRSAIAVGSGAILSLAALVRHGYRRSHGVLVGPFRMGNDGNRRTDLVN